MERKKYFQLKFIKKQVIVIIFVLFVGVGCSLPKNKVNTEDFSNQTNKPENQEQESFQKNNLDFNSEVFQNDEYNYKISLPVSWKAYSTYKGNIIAPSPKEFPSDPVILTGNPPELNFQISYLTDTTSSSYVNSVLKEAEKIGSNKYKRRSDDSLIYIKQHGDGIIKIFSSDSNYSYNDDIFKSIDFIK